MSRPHTDGALERLSAAVDRVSERYWALAYAVLALAYVVFCLHQPLSMNAYAGQDDAYFVNDARTMLAGQWLGHFDQMTLIKGPGFTYFLVANHLSGLPLTLSLSLLYVAACVVLSLVLRRVTSLGPLLTITLFALLLFQPAVVPNRVIRDAFYHSLFLFVVAGVIGVALDGRRRGWYARAALAGLALGWFWITREEGPWIIPGILLLFAAAAWRLWRDREGWLRPAAGVGVMALFAAVPVLATSAVNKAEYGALTVTDFSSGPYAAAISQLDRIQAGRELPRVPVSREALAAAYRVSPAARELRPFLDGPGGRNWAAPTCQIYPDECGEIAGGWFGWALRDAAAAAGHYRSGADADRYFDRLANQIADACDSGTLRCRTSPIPLMPVLTSDSLSRIPDAMVRAARYTTYEQTQPPAMASVGTPEMLRRASDVLGRPLLSRTEDRGFAAETASRWLVLKTDLQRVYRVIMTLLLGAGVVAMVVAILLWVLGRSVDSNTLLLAMVLWLFYVTRLGVIAIVDATAAPAVNAQYLEPAFLALCVAAFLSLRAAASGLRPSTAVREPRRWRRISKARERSAEQRTRHEQQPPEVSG